MTVRVHVPDLMDRSKVTAALPGAVVVRNPGDLATADAHDTVIVDLSRPGVLDTLPAVVATGARVIGFGSHVDTDLLDRARRAGCTEVLARSVFFSRLESGGLA